ncbi:MAG TPA: hypothetical protein VMU56_03000, partial [Beijerinckiaceae bacterium]|nr:hypothetical protein [Beijerinckiaceae bacterium]
RQKSKSARSFGRSLLERAGDAGDVVARLELACAMSRGRFGYREALHGFRTFFRLADEFVFPLVDQKLAAQPAKARSSLWSKLGLRRRKPSR